MALQWILKGPVVGVCWYNPFKVKDKLLCLGPLLQRRKYRDWRGCWVLEATDFTCKSTSLADITRWHKRLPALSRAKSSKGFCRKFRLQTALPVGPNDPSPLCLTSKWLKRCSAALMTSPGGRILTQAPRVLDHGHATSRGELYSFWETASCKLLSPGRWRIISAGTK